MKTTTNFLVNVQALGGKFLGPNAWEPGQIKLTLKSSLGSYDFSYYNGTQNDGDISPNSYAYQETSFLPIITPIPLNGEQVPIVNYLTPNDQTVVARPIREIALPGNIELATLQVEIPLPNNRKMSLEQPVLLNNQQQDYRIAVVVPGLLFKAISVDGSRVQATVTMMCGCTVKNDFYWLPSDFDVYAWVSYKNADPRRFQLSFDNQTNDSVFTGDIQHFDGARSILFMANQLSTGNYGFANYEYPA